MPWGLSPEGVAPTGHVPVSAVSADQQTLPLGLSFPQGKVVAAGPPRAAHSHSSSEGRRLFCAAQKAFACAKSTQTIGWSPWPGTSYVACAEHLRLLLEHLPVFTQAAYASAVVSVRSMHSAGMVASCLGWPVVYAPPGTRAMPGGHGLGGGA